MSALLLVGALLAAELAPEAAVRACPDAPVPRAGSPWGLHAALGGAVNRVTGAAALGIRYRLSDHWLVGGDAEWNPWVAINTQDVRAGVLNTYGTVVRRFPLTAQVSLRSSLHLGVSVLLFDLYGAPMGSFGPHIGFSILGLEYRLSPDVAIVFDPDDVAIPIPQVRGAPLAYRQYRMMIGIQIGG